ncbi:hypothetical protein [Pontibacter burrus]|uniref:Uncharacterized protein n=1 Tax=Pontibacter burrus TaxID=2704466 RepID=A0A6B3LVA6_9BACT|nr:hypothetical protein [Pontibacter burrus]NEM99703.1 hypothetical protein [Pontibacter burrus]
MESPFYCFGASSPVDLKFENNNSSDQILTLFQYTEAKGFDRIGTLKVNGESTKAICLENEGPIEEGLYIFNGEQTHKIQLKWAEDFILNLDDSTHLIDTPSELEHLLDPKW